MKRTPESLFGLNPAAASSVVSALSDVRLLAMYNTRCSSDARDPGNLREVVRADRRRLDEERNTVYDLLQFRRVVWKREREREREREVDVLEILESSMRVLL